MFTLKSGGRNRPALIAVTAALLLGATACAGGDDDDTETLRIAYLGVASWLPAMVAESEGFFAEEGIEIESTIVTNLATLPGAMGRQFDIASITVPDVIRAQANGIEVEVVAGEAWEVEETSSVRILAASDSGIESIEDLAGKRVAAGTLGGNIHPATLQWLEDSGVDTGQVTFSEVPFPQQQAQLNAGSVDAVQALEPFASAMIADGAVDLGSPLLALGDRVSISSWMADARWAEDNPELIEGFVAALEKANAFILENEEAARRILQEATELPEEVALSVTLPLFDFALDEDDEQLWREVVDAQG